MGGKKKVVARRISENFQPIRPISNGNRLIASNDQADIKATIVPILAPARNIAAAMGKLMKGPPGVTLPIAVPISRPLKPDSAPTHLDIISCGIRT